MISVYDYFLGFILIFMLVVWGARDRFIFVGYVERVRSVFVDAWVEIFEDVGYFFYLEELEWFVVVFSDFMVVCC